MSKIILCPLCESICLIDSNNNLKQGEYNICCKIYHYVDRPIHNTRTTINNQKNRTNKSKNNEYTIDSIFPNSITIK